MVCADADADADADDVDVDSMSMSRLADGNSSPLVLLTAYPVNLFDRTFE
jgi:hypothetical protein